MPLRRRVVSLLTVAASATGLLLAAGPAAAATPAQPQSIYLRSVGTNSLTVSSARASGASSYRLYASTVKADLYAYNIYARRSSRHVAASSSSVVTLGGLPTTSAVYYWRFASASGSTVHLSKYIYATNLRPATPTGFAAHVWANAYCLAWNGAPVTGYVIYQSADPAMRTGISVWHVGAPANQFTPYGLVPGKTYYFSIRAINGNQASGYSARTAFKVTLAQQPVRLVTFNALVRSSDGQMEGGERIAPWDTQRGPAAAALLSKANAQVVAVQEGGNIENGRGPRQVDWLASHLGPNWTVAATEPRQGQPGFVLTGNYVMYRNDLFTPFGVPGYWRSMNQYVASYQLLKTKATGAKFLVVSMHLRVGQTATDDNIRKAQMQGIIAAARRYATSYGVRAIVYGGDTNSLYARWHLDDTPGLTAYSAFASSAWIVAQGRWTTAYNSFNGNQRKAPTGLGSIDRIFADPGVALTSWSLLMNLDRYGRFVGPIPSDHNPLITAAMIPYVPYSS